MASRPRATVEGRDPGHGIDPIDELDVRDRLRGTARDLAKGIATVIARGIGIVKGK